jgi:glycosyltransferase involved in cell wall biosynthesis
MNTYESKSAHQSVTSTRPSFSMIFETENLASVELENIFRSLSSIAIQDISPEQANEFLVIDGGYAPPEIIAELCAKYPWITVKQAPGVGYYEAKMLGATLVTGEIVVYCDSDCVYVPNWLSSILSTFTTNPNVNIVAGETTTPVRNAYEIAIAMHYFFPRHSNHESEYLSNYYFLNNVAFRRHFLIKNPIPTNLPLYRGNCFTHSYLFCHLHGNKILVNPNAKASHEPPSPAFSFWRYLLLGHDHIVQKRICSILEREANTIKSIDFLERIALFTTRQKIKGIVTALLQFNPFRHKRALATILEDKKFIVLLPLAFFIIFYLETLWTIGIIVTYVNFDCLIRSYYGAESKDLPNSSLTN